MTLVSCTYIIFALRKYAGPELERMVKSRKTIHFMSNKQTNNFFRNSFGSEPITQKPEEIESCLMKYHITGNK